MVVFIIVICGFVVVAIDIYIKWNKLQSSDKSILDINTFDGLHSPYHPSVVYIENSWNGWEYWMAETPFSIRSKPYWDRNECPSIHVSHDGINWFQPVGLKNPIIDLTTQQVLELDFFSDCHLILNRKNELEIWFRHTRRHGDRNLISDVVLYRMKSRNGVDWDSPELISDLSEQTEEKGLWNTVVSPAIIVEDGEYIMWYVDTEIPSTNIQRGVKRSRSIDEGKTWFKTEQVKFNREISPWHIDIQLINGQYLMLVYDLNDLSLWESIDGRSFNFRQIIYSPSSKFGSSFFKLYRSCLIKDSFEYKIYMSGCDRIDTHIGLLHGERLEFLRQYKTNSCNFSFFLRHYYQYQTMRFKFILKNLFCK